MQIYNSMVEANKTIGSYGISFLDDYLGGIKQSDFILIGAGTGLGKSSLSYAIAFSNALAGRHVHLLALEADENEPFHKKMYQLLAQKYYDSGKYKHVEMSYSNFVRGKIDLPELIAECELELDKYYKLAVHYKDDGFSVDTLVDKLHEITMIRNKCDMIILDHIDYFDIISDNENREVSEIMQLLRQFNITWKIPIIVVSHVRKKGNRKQIIPDIDDFHGTSNKAKQVKTAITLAPDYEHTDYESGKFATFISVQKDRISGGSNIVGGCIFDRNRNTYEGRYRLLRSINYGEGVEEIENRPSWANHSTRPEQQRLTYT